jgi:large subunit ribosomal protein L24
MGRQREKVRTRIRIRKNDLVEVITGRDKGKRGKVLVVLPEKGRLLVQGVNFIKRHTRPNPQKNIKGGIAEREAPIHVSNVMIVSPDDDKRTRIGSKLLPDGRKARIGRRGGEVLDK